MLASVVSTCSWSSWSSSAMGEACFSQLLSQSSTSSYTSYFKICFCDFSFICDDEFDWSSTTTTTGIVVCFYTIYSLAWALESTIGRPFLCIFAGCNYFILYNSNVWRNMEFFLLTKDDLPWLCSTSGHNYLFFYTELFSLSSPFCVSKFYWFWFVPTEAKKLFLLQKFLVRSLAVRPAIALPMKLFV